MGKKKTIYNPCHVCWVSGKNKPGMDRAGRVCAIGLAFGFGFYFFRAEAGPAIIVIIITVISAAIDSIVSSRQKCPACKGTGTLKSIEITEDEE